MLFAFTVCTRSADTITPPTEPERVPNQYVDEWTTITAGLNGGISISIPNTWLSYEHIPNPGEEPFRGLTISSEAPNGLTISIWESPISHPSMIVEEFPYTEQFQFDDGFIGYMLENEEMLLWLHSGDKRLGILSIYLRHYDNKEIFADNQDLILRIVRSLRNNLDSSEETILPHPFATALMEYMAGYDGVVHAYLATLDDNETIGVLTTRPTTRVLVDYDFAEYAYGPSGMLFYIHDGDLIQIDVSGWLFVAGKYNQLMKRLDAHTHIVEVIYKLEFGRLEISTRLEYFSDDYLSMLFDEYDVAEFIAERDALAEYARQKYGLVALTPPNFGHMRNTEDQTAQILAMTINCIPSLAQ